MPPARHRLADLYSPGMNNGKVIPPGTANTNVSAVAQAVRKLLRNVPTRNPALQEPIQQLSDVDLESAAAEFCKFVEMRHHLRPRPENIG